MMICRIMYCLLIMLFFNSVCLASGTDESIIAVMNEARCSHFAFDPTEMGDSIYNPDGMDYAWIVHKPIYSKDEVNGRTQYWRRKVRYSVMSDTSLTLIDSVRINGSVFYEGENSYLQSEYTLELYKGDTDDYLVIARSDDTIYCMQYINSANSDEYYNGGVLSESVYAHFYQGYRTWDVLEYEYTAYFLDGTCVDLMFVTSTDELEVKRHYTGNDMLIKYFDICTYDEDFTDDFTMASK